jgi:hypothetical protein
MVNEAKQVKNNVSIRYYREGDEEQLNELFQEIFQANRSLNAWRWKYVDNPVTDLILISLAETPDGHIVGMFPILIMEFKVREEYLLAVQLVEIAIHSDFRGKWIIKELKYFMQLKTIETGMQFGFGFPTREHAKVGVRYMGYNLLGELPILGIAFGRSTGSGNPLFRRVLRKVRFLASYAMFYFRLFLMGRGEREKNGDVELFEFESFNEKFDDLWEDISNDYQIISHRSSRYLNWRYANNPMSDFTLLGARKDGTLKGYLVFTTRIEEDRKNGIIFDFIYKKNNSGGKLLLREGLFRLMRERVESIRCGALPHTDVHQYLNALGFTKWESSPLVNFEALDDRIDVELMSDLDEWFLSIGDTDLLGW